MRSRLQYMVIEITTETFSTLPTYGSVPIAFEVDAIYEISTSASGHIELAERKLETPYRKDYDAIPGNAPINWSSYFDLTNWGFIVARQGELRVGVVRLHIIVLVWLCSKITKISQCYGTFVSTQTIEDKGLAERYFKK